MDPFWIHLDSAAMPYISTTYSIKFAEDVKGGTVDFNLNVQTRNKLPERRPRGRPLKVPIVVSTNAAAPLVDAKAEIQLPP